MKSAYRFGVSLSLLGFIVVMITGIADGPFPGTEAEGDIGLLLIFGMMLQFPMCLYNCMLCTRRADIKKRIKAIEGELCKLLASGIIRLVSVPWLLSQPNEWIARRRQDLPEEAFLTPEEAVNAL